MTVSRRLAPILTALAALAAALIVAILVFQKDQVERDKRLSGAAERIEHQIRGHILTLQSVKALILADKAVMNRQRLSDFLIAMNGMERDGMQGIGVALALPPDAAALATERVARDYGVTRAPWPATDQQMRAPIVLLEPQDARNAAALNFDMFSEPVRREAMVNAITAKRIAVSGPVRLVQETDADVQTGFLLYLPVFHSEGLNDTPIWNDNDIAAFVYAPYRVRDLIQKVQKDLSMKGLTLTIYFDEERPQNLLFSTPGTAPTPVRITIPVADRHWIVRVGDAEARSLWVNPAIIVMMLGLVMSIGAAALAVAHLKTLSVAEQLAHESQAKAEMDAILLGEMQHRIKNSIARKLALFRLSARETTSRDDLINVFEHRMQAMSAAQDLVTGRTGGNLSLNDLIAHELRYWGQGWDTHSDHLITSGPELRLDATQVQALGLIIHELATNSLKYGALASGGTISVLWRVEPHTTGQMVHVDWRESGINPHATLKPGKTGYGSRLITMMVESQLRGRFERTLTPEGLAFSMRFPLSEAIA